MPQTRIGIVGVCAAGKSTLARALLERGYDARQISQEHSYVPDLWQRFSRADILIYLDTSLATLRQRRGTPDWPAHAYAEEMARLRHAREHCHLYICTDDVTPAEILDQVLSFLSVEQYKL